MCLPVRLLVFLIRNWLFCDTAFQLACQEEENSKPSFNTKHTNLVCILWYKRIQQISTFLTVSLGGRSFLQKCLQKQWCLIFWWCTRKGRLNTNRRTLCETLVCVYANYAKEQECLTDVVKLWGVSMPICTLTKSPHSSSGLKRILLNICIPFTRTSSHPQKPLTENTERKVSKISLWPNDPSGADL